jgi:hypothetical protein
MSQHACVANGSCSWSRLFKEAGSRRGKAWEEAPRDQLHALDAAWAPRFRAKSPTAPKKAGRMVGEAGFAGTPFSAAFHERFAKTSGNSKIRATRCNAKERGVTVREATGRQ